MDQKHTSQIENDLDSLKKTVQNLSSANAQLTAENAELRRKLERMNELLLLAQRARFGQSSEKREYVMQGGNQLQLFNEAEACQNLKEPEPTEETIVSEHTRKPKRTVDELTEGLPVEKVVLDIDADAQVCDTVPLFCVLSAVFSKHMRRFRNHMHTAFPNPEHKPEVKFYVYPEPWVCSIVRWIPVYLPPSRPAALPVFPQGMLCCGYYIQQDGFLYLTAVREQLLKFKVGQILVMNQVVHQEIISRHFQCVGYLNKGFQAHAFNAALDVAEVGGGLIDHLRKSTL